MKWLKFTALTKGFTAKRLACFFLDISRVIFLGAWSTPATAQENSTVQGMRGGNATGRRGKGPKPPQNDSVPITWPNLRSAWPPSCAWMMTALRPA